MQKLAKQDLELLHLSNSLPPDADSTLKSQVAAKANARRLKHWHVASCGVHHAGGDPRSRGQLKPNEAITPALFRTSCHLGGLCPPYHPTEDANEELRHKMFGHKCGEHSTFEVSELLSVFPEAFRPRTPSQPLNARNDFVCEIMRSQYVVFHQLEPLVALLLAEVYPSFSNWSRSHAKFSEIKAIVDKLLEALMCLAGFSKRGVVPMERVALSSVAEMLEAVNQLASQPLYQPWCGSNCMGAR